MEKDEELLVRSLAKLAYENGVIATMTLTNAKIEGIPERVDLSVTVEIIEK